MFYRIFRSSFVILLVAKAAAASAGEASSVDVLFFGEAAPTVVRFYLQQDGEPLGEAWQASRTATFAFLDADASGTLSPSETRRYPWVQQQRRASGGMLSSLFSKLRGPAQGVAANGLSRERFDEQYAFVRPLLLVAPVALFGPPADLFDVADANRDKRLAADELAALAARAAILDIDGDGSVAERELTQYDNPFAREADFYGRSQPGQPAPIDSAPWVSLADASQHSILALRIVERYARADAQGIAGDATVSAALAASLFAADADGDGRVDQHEVEAMLPSPTPDMEITLRLGASGGRLGASGGRLGASGELPSLEAVARPLDEKQREGQNSSTVRVEAVQGSGAALSLGDERCELSANLGDATYSETYEQQFDGADTDNNNYLDENESRNNGYFASSFARMDRDDDKKLFLEELKNYIAQESTAASSRLVLTYRSKGRTLFALLDDNADGRLGPRELAAAPSKIAARDADGDGCLGAAEIPLSFHLGVDRAQPEGLFAPFDPAAMKAAAPASALGPKWFRLGDRNRDGELSWNEFRGPRELFERLDASRDGTIDAREAQ